MPPTQTTAPSMCSAKASAAMSGPVRGMIKRYYSGYTLAYASYGKEGLSSVRASSSQRLLMALYVRRAPNPQCLAARAPDTDRKAVDDSYTWHKGGVHLYQARRTRHSGASCDSEDWTWQLPRLCVIDDRIPRSVSRPVSFRAICMFLRVMVPNMSAVARPTRGAKSICRAPAGSNLIRQTASLEIVTSSASLSRVTPARQFRSPAPTLEIRRTS